MPIAIPTFDELVNDAQKTVQDKTGITNFSESSVAGAMIKVYVAYLLDLYELLAQLDEQGNLSTARGANLDKIGELFGVTRMPAKAATSAGAGNTILFRNNTGNTVTIPAETRIWSPSMPNVSYYTNYSISVTSGAEQYVDVTAVAAGAQYNVGVGSLTMHDLGNSGITVRNVLPINNGSGLESDDNYRYRISNAITAQQGSNETSIRIKLLEIPGVKDVIIQKMARGTGTVDVVILPVDKRVSTELLNQVQVTLDNVVAFGISALAKAPEEVPLDLKIQVVLSSNLNSSTARSLASQAVRYYVDNLSIGDGAGAGSLIYYELISRVMDAHPDITNAQVRISARNQPILNTDLTAKPGEKFYIRSIDVT